MFKSISINRDELLFDIVFAVSVTIINWVFFNYGEELIANPPLFLFGIAYLMVTVMVPATLSFYVRRIKDNYPNKALKITWKFSAFFIMSFTLILAVTFIRYLFPEPEIYTTLFIPVLVLPFIGLYIGRVFYKKIPIDQKTKKKSNKVKIGFTLLSSISYALFQLVPLSMSANTNSNGSIGEMVAKIALMVFIGYIPIRILMTLAPPRNKLNVFIASIVLIYDVILL